MGRMELIEAYDIISSKKGETEMGNSFDHYKDKIRGSLVAGAAGDALGYPVEFISLKAIRKEFGQKGITGYSCDFNTGLAVFSDDTQMTLFTATGLLNAETARAQGISKNMYAFIHKAYNDWYKTQMGTSVGDPAPCAPESWLMNTPALYKRRAPGTTCLNALGTSKVRSLYKPLNNSKGCGGIMRVAPVGLLYPGADLEKIVEIAAEASAITHGHPLGCFPSGIFAAIVNLAAYSDGKLTLLEMTEKAVAAARALYGKSDMWDEMEAIVDKTVDLAAGSRSDEVNIKELGGGWVAEEALAVSLYCALRYENDLSACLIASVNHDGDSDSTGAIAGNILGALHGFEAIDKKWKTNLEMLGLICSLADDIWFCADPEHGDLCANEDWMRKYGSK